MDTGNTWGARGMTTLHDLCEQARNVKCVQCDAPAGSPCDCAPGDYHLRRFSRARCEDVITFDDIAYLIRNFLRVVHDPGEAA